MRLIPGLGALSVIALALTACAGPIQSAQPHATAGGVMLEVVADASAEALARSDEQGAVGFLVTPLNLQAPGDTLDFDVSMTTHSVELAWDLAAQSRLVADTGREVRGQSWPVGSGHHYEGTLSFSTTTADGESLLDGAKSLTLIISGTGVPERVFDWDLIP